MTRRDAVEQREADPREDSTFVRALERLARSRGACLVSYVLLYLASFYPQSLRPHDTIAYVGDSLYCVYVVGWLNQQILDDPLHWYDANVLYPNQRTLTFGDHQLLPSLLVGPVFWATGNPVLGYNVSVAFACLLAAFALRHLALRLGVGSIGAWSAGALYAFHTYQIHEGPRLMILYHGFLALALAELLGYLQTGASKHAVRLGVVMLLQGLSSSYHLAYGCLVLGLVVVVYLVVGPRATFSKLPRLAAVTVVAGLFYLPVLWPYLLNAAQYGYQRELPSGIDLAHYVSTTPTNLWYGAIGTEVRFQQLGPHFIGFLSIASALLALGAWGLRRLREPEGSLLRPGTWVPFAAGFGALFLALSLGKDVEVFGASLGPGPYRLLFHFVPGFQLLRVPERLGLVAMLFIALLAGMGVTLLRRRGHGVAAALLALAIPLEHLSPLPRTERVPVGSEIPAVYEWLKDDSANAVAEVPIHGESLIRKETIEMYFSTRHLKPIVHGYTAYPPLLAGSMRRLAWQFPEDVSLRGLSLAGVDTVVVHRGREGARELAGEPRNAVAAGKLERVARFAGEMGRVFEARADEVYRIVDPPELEAAPRASGSRVVDPSWRFRTKEGDPLPAADGDLSTAWVVGGPLDGDEFYEVTFDRPLPVSGLRMRLRQDSVFPTRFKIAGRRVDGRWVPVAFYDDAHELQLLEHLLTYPGEPVLDFAWGERELTGLMVMVDEGGESTFGWSVPEIEVLAPDP